MPVCDENDGTDADDDDDDDDFGRVGGCASVCWG